MNSLFVVSAIFAIFARWVPHLWLPAIVIGCVPLLFWNFGQKTYNSSATDNTTNASMNSLSENLMNHEVHSDKSLSLVALGNGVGPAHRTVGMFGSTTNENRVSTSTIEYGLSLNNDGELVRCSLDGCIQFRFVKVPLTDAKLYVSTLENPYVDNLDTPEFVGDDSTFFARDPTDAIYSGDLVRLHCEVLDKYIVHLPNNLLTTSSERNDIIKSVFHITILDKSGLALSSEPLSCGRSFRLRSARWPKYEIGCLDNGSTVINQNTMKLVMYEWSNISSKAPVKWRHGSVAGTICALDLAVCLDRVRSTKQSSLAMTSSPMKQAGYLFRSKLVAAAPVFSVTVRGAVAMTNRLLASGAIAAPQSSQPLLPSQSALLLHCQETSGDSVIRKWVCIRREEELSKLLSHVAEVVGVLEEVTAETADAVECRGSNLVKVSLFSRKFAVLMKAVTEEGRKLLLASLQGASIWDTWLLTEPEMLCASVDIVYGSAGAPINSTVVLRAHDCVQWSEEVMSLFAPQVQGIDTANKKSPYLSFFSPNSKKSTATVHLIDIIEISLISSTDISSPLPGFEVCILHSLHKTYFLAWGSSSCRATFLSVIIGQYLPVGISCGLMSIRNPLDPRVHCVNDVVCNAATITSGPWLPSSRRVLNTRKMFASKHGEQISVNSKLKQASSMSASSRACQLSISLLQQAALAASTVAGQPLPGSPAESETSNLPDNSNSSQLNSSSIDLLASFGDATSQLQHIALNELDFQAPETLCFFVNVFHTLVIHSRIAFGAPNKQEWAAFFANCSYEIGDTVFSLHELEHCVIRGSSSKAQQQLKHAPPPVPPSDSHRVWALHHSRDERINFILNLGSVSSPGVIHLLTPSNLEVQLQKAAVEVLHFGMSVDLSWRTVTLPKVCEMYAEDFDNDVIHHCLKHLQVARGAGHDEDGVGADLATLLDGTSRLPSIKYLNFTFESQEALELDQ